MIEVFPNCRRRVTHNLSSVRLINVDFIAEADFHFGSMNMVLGFMPSRGLAGEGERMFSSKLC